MAEGSDARRAPRAAAAAPLALLLLLCCAGPSPAQSVPPSRVLQEGEDLVYNVRYTFIDLGQIRIRTLRRTETAAATEYHARALIDSYKGLPLVDLHAVFDSRIDSAFFSRWFSGRTLQDGRWDFGRYTFDPAGSRSLIEVGKNDTLVTGRDTLPVRGTYQDGLSLFFWARDRLLAGRTLAVPALVKERIGDTRINFTGEREEAEIDAVDYPVDVVHFEGTADFEGIYGMTGDFEGWFSNDEARVPIKAKVRVLIGSVTIELMRWTRAGWAPPRARG